MHGNPAVHEILGIGLMAVYFLLPLILAAYALRRVHHVEKEVFVGPRPSPKRPAVDRSGPIIWRVAATGLLVATVPAAWVWGNESAAVIGGSVVGSAVALWGLRRRSARVVFWAWLGSSVHYWTWDLAAFWPPIRPSALVGVLWFLVGFAAATSATIGKWGRLLARAHAVQALFVVNSLVGWDGLELGLIGAVATTVAFILTAHRRWGPSSPASDQASSMTGFTSVPTPEISTSTRSPPFINN